MPDSSLILRELETTFSPMPSPRLKDRDVRNAVHREIVPALISQGPSKVVDEFPLCLGEARVDVAVINGKLHGIEIKSEADTLGRLSSQVQAYSRVFDTMTIVCGRNHLAKTIEIVPEWWAVYTAEQAAEIGVRLRQVRTAGLNTMVDADALSQFLWKEELRALVIKASPTKRTFASWTRSALRAELTQLMPLHSLQEAVRIALKARAAQPLGGPQK